MMSDQTFDPVDWLARFEAAGGTLMIAENGQASLLRRIWGIPEEDQFTSCAMQDALSDDQLEAVIEARMAEAEAFDPEQWCQAFISADGNFHVREGRPWTGIPEREDGRAMHLRNRLTPQEAAKLRSFLRHLFKLEETA